MSNSKNTNLNNLKPFQKGQLTSEEAKARGHNGGKKSAEARKTKKLFLEIFDNLLDLEVYDEKNGLITSKQKLALEVIKKATKGDLEAFKIVRDTIGEAPKLQVDASITGLNDVIKNILLEKKADQDQDLDQDLDTDLDLDQEQNPDLDTDTEEERVDD
jgi:hypothetical protein